MVIVSRILLEALLGRSIPAAILTWLSATKAHKFVVHIGLRLSELARVSIVTV